MSRVLLLKRASPFAYPGGPPGFDPTHVAALNTQFSAVFAGGGFVNLVPGFAPLQGTPSGTPANGIDAIIGPCKKQGTNYSFQFSTPAGVNAPVTMAAIIRPGAAENSVIFEAQTSNTATTATLADYSGSLYFSNGTTDFNSGITLTANTPYFVAATSVNDGTFTHLNWIARNLKTGAVKIANFDHTDTDTVLGSGITIGFGYRFSVYFTGNIAAVAYIKSLNTPPQLMQWAADPWSFWYP